MKFAFYTLGCKVNQYETQAMEQQLAEMGHCIGDFSEPCDGYIINTCTVTAVADKKNRNIIRRCRRRNPQAVVGVCGCYAQVSPEQIRALGVDVISGSGERQAFVQMMVEQAQRHGHAEHLDNAMERRSFESLPAGGLPERTRAMLKVQDGCSNFCSYCIIPFARGPVRSLPLAEAVAQAQQLAREGYREIVVTGIEIASWGQDFRDGSTLVQLLQALCEATPQVRLRLGSLEPRVVDENFCRTLSRYANLCPQFHLALQSGSDTVLRRMNRHYSTQEYLHCAQLLRTWFPGCAITTDLIVAFPGETEQEFAETLDFLRRCRLAQVHVFPYSRRPGTRADTLPGQHGNATKQARSAEAIAVAAQLNLAYRQAMTGTVQQVLFEQPEEGLFAGHAMNYVKVYCPGQGLHNQVRAVRVTGCHLDGVLGTLADEPTTK